MGSLPRAVIVIPATGGTPSVCLARKAGVAVFIMQMRKLTLRGEGTSWCRAARQGEARI